MNLRHISAIVLLLVPLSFCYALEKRAQGKPCSVDGKTIVDGNTFTLGVSGPCVTYRCVDGQVMPNSYGCSRDGACHPEGDTYNIGCIQRKCSLVNGNFGYRRVNEGCAIKDTCLKVNETYQDGCFKYQCKKGGNAFSLVFNLEQVEWGCSNGGKCYPPGHTIEVQCRQMKCEQINGIAGFRNFAQGCPFGSSECIKVGEQKIDSCRVLECQKHELNGVPYYSVEFVGVKCEDANKNCQDPGTFFPFLMGGAIRNNCTCHVEGFNVQYYC